jgi:hypothetical protein
MNINPFGLGAGLILVGLIADRKKLMRSVALEAHEGDDYMAEKLTKSKINYNQWAQGLSAMKRWKSYDRFLTHLATGARPTDTKEAMMKTADEDFNGDMNEEMVKPTMYIGNSQYAMNQEVPVWDLAENTQIIASDLKGLMTTAMIQTLGRTDIPNTSGGGLRRNMGDMIWTERNASIPHKKTGKPTSQRMNVEYRYQPSTGEIIKLGVPDYNFKDRSVRFKDGQRISMEDFNKLRGETMNILRGENAAYNYHLLRQMSGEDISDEKLEEIRSEAMKAKANRVNTLTGAERKLLRKTYMSNYFNGGINPITGRDMLNKNWRIWDDSQKYDGTYGAKGGGLESIVYALKCSKVMPDVKTLRKSSNRRNATFKPSTEAYVVDKTIPSYRRTQGIVVVNNYDFMPHLETMEKWVRFNEVARATPKITADMAFYKNKIDENQAIVDKYESMNIQEEINTRVNALKAQLMGEYGLEREKQQAIQVAEEKIRQNKIYLKGEQDKLESLMNS